MTKLVLGKTPKFFKPIPVKFILPDGTEDQLLVTYHYKTRSDFAAFLNKLFREVTDGAVLATEEKIDFEAVFKRGSSKTVDHLVEIVGAWDLDAPLTAESFRELHNEVPAAAAAITAAYSLACSEGRLGN